MAISTKNFKVEEFTCHCGCKLNNIEQDLIDMCQVVREALGVPVRVNSGCRCVKHNAKVGGVRNSQHLTGHAADLSCGLGSRVMFDTVRRLYNEGKLPQLRYCKRYKTWIHVDCGAVRRNMFEDMKG